MLGIDIFKYTGFIKKNTAHVVISISITLSQQNNHYKSPTKTL